MSSPSSPEILTKSDRAGAFDARPERRVDPDAILITCNKEMQISQGVVFYDWLNVIAKFEARTTEPSIFNLFLNIGARWSRTPRDVNLSAR